MFNIFYEHPCFATIIQMTFLSEMVSQRTEMITLKTSSSGQSVGKNHEGGTGVLHKIF